MKIKNFIALVLLLLTGPNLYIYSMMDNLAQDAFNKNKNRDTNIRELKFLFEINDCGKQVFHKKFDKPILEAVISPNNKFLYVFFALNNLKKAGKLIKVDGVKELGKEFLFDGRYFQAIFSQNSEFVFIGCDGLNGSGRLIRTVDGEILLKRIFEDFSGCEFSLDNKYVFLWYSRYVAHKFDIWELIFYLLNMQTCNKTKECISVDSMKRLGKELGDIEFENIYNKRLENMSLLIGSNCDKEKLFFIERDIYDRTGEKLFSKISSKIFDGTMKVKKFKQNSDSLFFTDQNCVSKFFVNFESSKQVSFFRERLKACINKKFCDTRIRTFKD